jgi:hypothetical protein
MRFFAGAALVVLLGLSAASAADTTATVKSIDKNKNKITVTVDGKDKTFAVSKDASLVTVTMVPGKKGKTTEKLTPIENGLEGVKVGTKVTLLTETVDGTETITSLKVSDGKAAVADPKKKKKKKNN